MELLGRPDFYQRRSLRKHSFWIKEKSLKVKYSTITSTSVHEIPFENISNEYFETTSYSNALIFFSITFAAVATLVTLVNLINTPSPTTIFIHWAIAILLILITYFSKQSLKYLYSSPEVLVFFKNKSSEKSLNNFISDIFDARNSYLKENYTLLENELTVVESIERIKALLDLEVITKEEFETLKKQFLSSENDDKRIGF